LWRSNDATAQAEMQRRVAHAFMLPVLLAWLYGLVRSDRRGAQQDDARAGGRDMLIMAIVFVLYMNMINLVTVWIGSGKLAVWPGFWWVHGLLLLLAVSWQSFTWPMRRRIRTVGRPG
jgi:lipopolysaccharide export LptBFGC system permease protein LptF